MTYKARNTTPKTTKNVRKHARRELRDPGRHARRVEEHKTRESRSIDVCPVCASLVLAASAADTFHEGDSYTCPRGHELVIAIMDGNPPMAYLVEVDPDPEKLRDRAMRGDEAAIRQVLKLNEPRPGSQEALDIATRTGDQAKVMKVLGDFFGGAKP